MVKMATRWHIDAVVDLGNNRDVWHLTDLYGYPDTSKRDETWSLLESIRQVSDIPWLALVILTKSQVQWRNQGVT